MRDRITSSSKRTAPRRPIPRAAVETPHAPLATRCTLEIRHAPQRPITRFAIFVRRTIETRGKNRLDHDAELDGLADKAMR
jgi:hypothetical protein